MPNQRSKDKVYLGGFIDRELEKRLIRMAHQAGMDRNKFGFATQLIREALERRNAKRRPKAPAKKTPRPPAPKTRRKKARSVR